VQGRCGEEIGGWARSNVGLRNPGNLLRPAACVLKPPRARHHGLQHNTVHIMSPATLPASAYDALELKPETVQRLITQRRGASPSSIASPNLLQHNLDQQQPECRPQLNESCIFLYAEVLLHIRTVTLFASLHTCHNRETKVELTANGRSITVTHEGESATLRLPIKVEGGGDAALSLPAQPPNKELTLRLQIQEKDDSDLLAPLQSEERKTNIVPWDGAFMSALENAIICCANCHQEVVPAGKIRVWRDLPNENWAEMMDFWHCHKPDEHHLHDHIQRDAIGRKGYAAGNILRTVAGTGYVDLGSFLLKEHDCRGIKVGRHKSHWTHTHAIRSMLPP